MDPLAVEQYRWLLATLVIAASLGIVAALVLSRRRLTPAEPAPMPAVSSSVLPVMMIVLVAVAVGAGLFLVLPAAMILRYFRSWQVALLLMAGAAMLAAPVVYAWRTRAL